MIEHLGAPHGDDAYLAEMAIKIADQDDKTGNLLLAEQASDLLAMEPGADRSLVERVEAVRDSLCNRWENGELLRWLDNPVADEQHMHSDRDRLATRLWRTISWAEGIQSGDGHAAFVTVPAFNEESELPYLFNSLKQPTKYPVIAVVVADNNSIDETAAVVRQHGANLIKVSRQGVGPAREGALAHARQHMILPPGQMIFMGTDADAIYSPGFIDATVDAFAEPGNEHKLVANGKVNYRFYWPDRPYANQADPQQPGKQLFTDADIDLIDRHFDPATGIVTVDDFRSYAFFTNTRTFRERFAELGYDIRDFIKGDSCRMIPGPNAIFRGSLHQYHLPEDQRWEQHHVAIMLQVEHSFDDIGMTVGNDDAGAGVTSSARGIIDPSSYVPGQLGRFTADRLREIRHHGIVPYKSGNNQLPELASFALTIDDIHRNAYDLEQNQSVDGYYRTVDEADLAVAACGRHTGHQLRQAIHAGTRRPLGKFAVIGHQD